MNYLYIPLEYVQFGKERRNMIKSYFNSMDDSAYAVNCKYRPQLKNDPDLQKLIKTGFLKITRTGLRTSRKTILIKNLSTS